MDALRTLISALAHYDPEANDRSEAASYRKAVRLTAQVASVVATYARINAGGGPIDPDPALSHAANFLLMLQGDRPSELATRAFDVALILHADHELNASTFAARVTAATLSDVHSATVAGIGPAGMNEQSFIPDSDCVSAPGTLSTSQSRSAPRARRPRSVGGQKWGGDADRHRLPFRSVETASESA